MLWCAVLFVGTCTVSASLLIHHFTIDFQLSSPRWSELFKLDIIPRSDTFIIQKIGHFTGFFILSLLMTRNGRQPKGLIYAVLYALLTEILQLFFSRDGRLFDVVIDSAGIFLAYGLCRLRLNRRRMRP